MSATDGADPGRECELSRRGFLAGGAMLGSWLALRPTAQAAAAAPGTILTTKRADARYELADAEHQILSACLQCNTGCGMRVKLQDGVATKIDGNPYSPWTLLPHLP